MGEYDIIPESRYSKFYPLLVIAYFLVAVAFSYFGCVVTAVGFILAFFFLFCSLYYGGLFLYYRYYRVHISSNSLTVCNIINRRKTYQTDTLQWKIVRIPWYNSYFILLYSSTRFPVAVVRPHWKNVRKILKCPHLGKLNPTELEYIIFMKKVGLL